jgi:hypothetical protein
LQELLEPASVDLVRAGPQDVARGTRNQSVRAKLLAELGNEVVERGRSRARRLLFPQIVQEPVRRYDTTRLDQKRCKQSALSLAAEGNRLALRENFERAEYAELKPHGRALPPNLSCV